MNQKTQEVILYLLKERLGATITEIIKLCYLIDLITTKKIGYPITNLNYYRYSFGPFDKKIYQTLEEMIDNKLVKQEIKFKPGGEVVLYTLANDSCDLKELKIEEINIVDDLLESLAGYGPKALTEITYNTTPMKALKATLGGKEGWKQELDLLK
jgi:hypothetical protein